MNRAIVERGTPYDFFGGDHYEFVRDRVPVAPVVRVDFVDLEESFDVADRGRWARMVGEVGGCVRHNNVVQLPATEEGSVLAGELWRQHGKTPGLIRLVGVKGESHLAVNVTLTLRDLDPYDVARGAYRAFLDECIAMGRVRRVKPTFEQELQQVEAELQRLQQKESTQSQKLETLWQERTALEESRTETRTAIRSLQDRIRTLRFALGAREAP